MNDQEKVNLGRGRHPADLTGPYFLRYSLADGTRPWEAVGNDLDAAIDAQMRKQAHFEALDANVSVIRTTTKQVRRKSRTPCISGSLSFNFFWAKTNKATAKRRCERTTTVSDIFLDFTAQQNLPVPRPD